VLFRAPLFGAWVLLAAVRLPERAGADRDVLDVLAEARAVAREALFFDAFRAVFFTAAFLAAFFAPFLAFADALAEPRLAVVRAALADRFGAFVRPTVLAAFFLLPDAFRLAIVAPCLP
jgi:hypothetical protein